MGERGIVHMWIDSAVRLLAPSSSFWTHGWHSSRKVALPEVLNACSGQHVMSGFLLQTAAFHSPPSTAASIHGHSFAPRIHLILLIGSLPGSVLQQGEHHHSVQVCAGKVFRCLHHCSAPIAEDSVLTIRLFAHSQAQLVCLLYSFQGPWLSCAAKEPSESAWQILSL